MKRKILFIVGIGTGYVIGARAGREKYDKLVKTLDHFWQDARVSRVRDDVTNYARTQAPILVDRAEAVAKAAPATIAGAARDVADKTTAVARDVADKTTAAAKEVADKTTAIAKDVADKTTDTAKDLAGRVTGVADDVKGQVNKTATDLKDRGEDAVGRVTMTMGEARDRALEDDTDDDDDDVTDVTVTGEFGTGSIDPEGRDDAR
jgi:gas vesicle protein